MMEINGSDRLRFGAYEVDLHTHELWKHGTRVKLVGQPFEILAVLVKRPDQLVTREELRTQLWPGDTFVDFNHGLNAAVNKLRDALCDSAGDPKYIETLPRRGYRFIAAVESTTPGSAKRLTASPSGDAGSQSQTLAPDEPPATRVPEAGPSAVIPTFDIIANPPNEKPWWLRRGLPGLAVILIMWFLVNIGIFDMLRSHSERAETHARESATPGSLAPLTELSDGTDNPAFSPDGNRVAFRRESFVPGDSGIWVKHVGGEELIQLTNSSGDCCPVWSPNGQSVAFSRLSDQQRTIYEVPATGGEVRKIYSGSLVPGHAELDWSPDGHNIAFVEKDKQGTSAIFTLSRGNQTAHQITAPAAPDEDWGPAFSPDGNQIAFVRAGNLLVMPAAGGESRRLTQASMRVLGSPAWTPDGQSIIFAVPEFGERRGDELWRIPAAGGEPTLVRQAGIGVRNPAIAKGGFRLACVGLSNARSIDQMDLYPPGQKARTLVTSMSGENAGQQLSPDGRKLAFQSDRTGGLDIWVSDRNGQNPIQFTAVGTAGAPRWSPDGKEIVFDVGLGRAWTFPRAVFLIDADGRSSRPLVQDNFSNPRPSWSHDGKWIYFASDRSGDWQVWKILRSGGSPVQVTRQGGFAAEESPDGAYLYYAKHRYEFPEIWRVPVGGGYETPAYPGIRPLDWAAWTLVENGILYVEPTGSNQTPTVSFHDFSAHSVRHLAVLDKPPFWVTATRDGKSVIFDQPGQEESHVMLLENFR